jgi:hypothetical protein
VISKGPLKHHSWFVGCLSFICTLWISWPVGLLYKLKAVCTMEDVDANPSVYIISLNCRMLYIGGHMSDLTLCYVIHWVCNTKTNLSL